MGAGHGRSHGHTHGRSAGAANQRRLAITLVLVVAYMGAEVAGGLLANSLALLADAGHMLSDAGALALALFAVWLARKPATARHTYGYHRVEILAALANAGALVGVALLILLEAFRRLGQPPEVEGGLMMGIAFGALLVNLAGLWILGGGRGESLNVRGAWLHVLMEGAPPHLDVEEVGHAIGAARGVCGVHDLHVWTITSGVVALSAHVVTDGTRADAGLIPELSRTLHDRFGIEHTTFQLEPGPAPATGPTGCYVGAGRGACLSLVHAG